MKTLLILACSHLFFLQQSVSQKMNADKIPTSVSAAFKSKFPTISKVKWEKENQNQYEAEFKQNKKEQSVLFDESGKWLETEMDIPVSALPPAVLQSMNKEFPGFEAEEANSIDHAQYGNCFAMEIEKGKEEFEVLFKATGEFMGKRIEEEDND